MLVTAGTAWAAAQAEYRPTLHPTRAVFVAYRRHGYTISAIADHLECHYSTVSRRLRREEALETVHECKT